MTITLYLLRATIKDTCNIYCVLHHPETIILSPHIQKSQRFFSLLIAHSCAILTFWNVHFWKCVLICSRHWLHFLTMETLSHWIAQFRSFYHFHEQPTLSFVRSVYSINIWIHDVVKTSTRIFHYKINCIQFTAHLFMINKSRHNNDSTFTM